MGVWQIWESVERPTSSDWGRRVVVGDFVPFHPQSQNTIHEWSTSENGLDRYKGRVKAGRPQTTGLQKFKQISDRSFFSLSILKNFVFWFLCLHFSHFLAGREKGAKFKMEICPFRLSVTFTSRRDSEPTIGWWQPKRGSDDIGQRRRPSRPGKGLIRDRRRQHGSGPDRRQFFGIHSRPPTKSGLAGCTNVLCDVCLN